MKPKPQYRHQDVGDARNGEQLLKKAANKGSQPRTQLTGATDDKAMGVGLPKVVRAHTTLSCVSPGATRFRACPSEVQSVLLFSHSSFHGPGPLYFGNM